MAEALFYASLMQTLPPVQDARTVLSEMAGEVSEVELLLQVMPGQPGQ